MVDLSIGSTSGVGSESESMVGNGSALSVGSTSKVGSNSEFAVGLGSKISAGSRLGMSADSDFAHSVTGEFVLPSILQSTEGNFQHYDHWMHSMCTAHEGNPFGNAQIPHRCSTGLIHDLILLHGQILLLDL